MKNTGLNLMKNKGGMYQILLTLTALISFSIIFSFIGSATTAQNASTTAQYAYVTNYNNGTVSVIDTDTNTVKGTVEVEHIL
jgi:YVTN family beta-propeller protein